MQIDIQTKGFGLTPSLVAHVARRLRAIAGRLGPRLRQITAHLSDQNGPRGGIDKQCHLVLHVDGAAPVVVTDARQDLYLAVDRAAERARRALTRRLKRARRISDRHSASGQCKLEIGS
jgi:ribosome-associated translation inhibitor RaiA